MTFSLSRASNPASRLLVVTTLILALLGGEALTRAAPAEAASPGISLSVAIRAVNIAASKRGAPYLYGAAGPSRFDCSGFTQWVFARVGRRLPRTAAQQYAASIKLPRKYLRYGDLVFFRSGRSIYHVGIYALRGRIWYAPKAGSRVKLGPIFSSNVVYGRVR